MPYVFGERKKALRRLQELLKIELITIGSDRKQEKQSITELEIIERDQKVRRIQRLEWCLARAEGNYKLIYSLLQNLHTILSSEKELIKKIELAPDLRRYRKHIPALQIVFLAELKIRDRIEITDDFHLSMSTLTKGEQIIHKMNTRERRLVAKMQKGMQKIVSNELTTGITYQWTMTVFNAIEDNVHEWVAQGFLEGYHPDIDFEFVNHPEFIELSSQALLHIRKKPASKEMIKAFVHLFRDWFNGRG